MSGDTMWISAPRQPLGPSRAPYSALRCLGDREGEATFGGHGSGAAAADASPHLVANCGWRDLCGPINAGEINEWLPLAEYF